jgi:hypothetical protein
MSFPPNTEFFNFLIKELDREYDISIRLSRYGSAAPELLSFAINEGLTEEEATRALFVADFIATASEVPPDATDDDRYRSVIRAFIAGRNRNKSADKLMHVFYIAYKTAIKIRSQDLFMGDRGMPRKVALLRIKDFFIIPYLKVVGDYLMSGSCGWELGLLAAALKRTYPHEEIVYYKNQPDHENYSQLVDPIWKLLLIHSNLHQVSQNPSVTIPNMTESQALIVFDKNQPSLISTWNFDLTKKLSKLQTHLQSLTKFLDKKLMNSEPMVIKGRFTNTLENFFLIRDPLTHSAPMFLLKTPSDDVYSTSVSHLIHLRGLEEQKSGSWRNSLLGIKKHKLPELEKSVEGKKSGGLVSRLFGRFRKQKEVKKEDTSSTTFQIEEKSVKGTGFVNEASFIPQALLIEAVSGIQIIETFDILREGNYEIEGVFEKDLTTNRTTFLSKPTLTSASSIMSFLDLIKDYLAMVFQELDLQQEIIMEEVFLSTAEKEKYLLTLDGNQSMIVGLFAKAPPDAPIADWQARQHEVEPLQRKSLAMRINQYLKARRHTQIEEAIERIYGQNFIFSAAKKEEIG